MTSHPNIISVPCTMLLKEPLTCRFHHTRAGAPGPAKEPASPCQIALGPSRTVFVADKAHGFLGTVGCWVCWFLSTQGTTGNEDSQWTWPMCSLVGDTEPTLKAEDLHGTSMSRGLWPASVFIDTLTLSRGAQETLNPGKRCHIGYPFISTFCALCPSEGHILRNGYGFFETC